MLGRCACVVLLCLTLTAPAAAEQRLTLLQARDGLPTSWTARPDGSDLRTVVDLDSDPTLDPSSSFWAVAPNGRDFAVSSFTKVENSLGVFVDDAPVPNGFLSTDQAGLAGAVYAPSGDRVAVVIGTDVELIALPGGAVTNLGTIPGVDPNDLGVAGYLAGPVWSPDETTLAFLTPAGLELVPIDGSAHRKVPVVHHQTVTTGIAWKPSGDAILVAVVAQSLLVEVSLTSNAQPILADDASFVTEGAYAPDGTRIAYLDDDERLVVIRADGTRPVHFGDSSEGAWSPDSTRLAFASARHGVRIANADGSHNHRILPPSLRMVAVTGWLGAALTPPPDTSEPQPEPVVVRRRSFGGGFSDPAPRSTPVVAARVSVVRHLHGRCQGLTRHGFRPMSCVRARRTFVPAPVVAGRNGAEWRIRRRLPKGIYAIRVQARDAAGNTSTPPGLFTVHVGRR